MHVIDAINALARTPQMHAIELMLSMPLCAPQTCAIDAADNLTCNPSTPSHVLAFFLR